jgi:hypothetical protein
MKQLHQKLGCGVSEASDPDDPMFEICPLGVRLEEGGRRGAKELAA